MTGRFSTSSIDQIRAASDIKEIVGSYLPLKRAGANYVALCPFHREKTPSFSVNPQKQIFYCFGCHKGGDVFAFIQAYENVDFAEAARRLAERARIPLEFESDAGYQQARHIKEKLWLVHEQIAQHWQQMLADESAGKIARNYLSKRAVADDAVRLFRIGYAPDAWEDTVNWAKRKGFDLSLVEQAGLVLRGESGKYYDRFRCRLIFPICDDQGRIIGFSGRILKEDPNVAKYVNSPETPIFSKRKVFFGLDKSKRAILDAQCAVICEGQLDLISCFMAGITNIAAPQGTALTADHARILKRFTSEVVLCFDSDLAGRGAAVRSLDELLASDLSIRVAIVPAPHDPDSYIRNYGGPAFRELIDHAEGYFDFYLKHLGSIHDVQTDKGQLAVLKAMGEAVRKTGNAVLIDKYAQKTALQIGVSPNAVRAEFAKVKLPHAFVSPGDEQPAPGALASPRPSPQELWLLKLLFLDDTNIEWAALHLDPAWIQHPDVQQIVASRIAAFNNQAWQGPAPFLSALPNETARSLLSEALLEQRTIPNPIQQLQDLLARLRNQAIDRQISLLGQRAGKPELNDLERLDLLQRQQQLRAQKRQPLGPPG